MLQRLTPFASCLNRAVPTKTWQEVRKNHRVIVIVLKCNLFIQSKKEYLATSV